MMDNFVNKIKTKDNKEYEIHDERIREVTSADAGKVVKVDAEGKLVIE